MCEWARQRRLYLLSLEIEGFDIVATKIAPIDVESVKGAHVRAPGCNLSATKADVSQKHRQVGGPAGMIV